MNEPTITIIGAKARKMIKLGVNAIYEPVRRTFGHEGKNGLIYRTLNRGLRITNDGFANAEVIEPKNPFVNLVANAFKEACKKTNEKVGDGTTLTIILAGHLYNVIYDKLSEKQSSLTAGSIGVMTLKRQIVESAENIKKEIKKRAIPIKDVKDLEKIAMVSVEDEKLGKEIAKMAFKVGIDGYIDVVEGYKGTIETETIEGLRFPAKVANKAFINRKERFEMVALDTPVLITNYVMDNLADFALSVQEIGKQTSKLILIAPSYSENVLQQIANACKSGYFIYPVLAPAVRTEVLEDIAAYCDAQLIDKNTNKKLNTVKFSDLGFLEKLVVKDTEVKEDAMATGGRGAKKQLDSNIQDNEIKQNSRVSERIEILKGQLKETRQENFKKLLQRRIGSMSSAIGIIRVGASTEAETYYKKLKVEDAVYACKAALRGGYVKGGGLCLKEIADKLSDDDILKATLKAPFEQIESSIEGDLKISDDIIDPAEVSYHSVEHAISVVSNLATVEIITSKIDETLPSDGYMAIARAINETSILKRREMGLIKENEEEMYRDQFGEGGVLLADSETEFLDQG